MTDHAAIILINKIRTRFIMMRVLETVLFSVGFMLLVYGVSVFTGFSQTIRVAGSAVAGFLFFIAELWIKDLLRVDRGSIVQYVSLHHPELEFSTDLLLIDDAKLTRLERLQKERTRIKFERIIKSIKVPYSFLRPGLIMLVGGLSAILLSGIDATKNPQESRTADVVNTIQDKLPPALKDFEVTITAPAYMQVKRVSQHGPGLNIREGSDVLWSFDFSDTVKAAYFIFSGSDSVSLKKAGGSYSFSKRFFESGFYQIGWKDQEDNVFTSDYYRIEVQQDAPPVIEITNPPQFLEVELDNDQRINVTSLLKDDWGIRDAHIIATISKGSGESVKFREEKLLFTKPKTFSGKSIEASLQIDLTKMGMEPGDELYFYVVAFDNKQPHANRTRTETHFIVMADTARIEWAMDDGLGVDLMPEYFRSQRQIIMDTEKLLREKKAVTKQEFNSRSNELGYDQKLLRLKYGEFLGEEFESGIAHEAEHHESADDHDHDDPLAAYSHKHDVEEEHQEVVLPDKKEGQKENPLAAFMHNHDDSETSTFFEQSIRAKLKAALAVMWDAELYLRLYEPDKSLPFQYKALKLLKEISNASRIYVHKVGFDPPPVKEEKRLTGELKDVYSKTMKWDTSREPKFPYTLQAIRNVETMLTENRNEVLEEERFVFQNSGNEVAVALLENPTAPLETLTLLKNLSDGMLQQDGFTKSLTILRKNLIQLLPFEPESVQKNPGVIHPLEGSFTEVMGKNQ